MKYVLLIGVMILSVVVIYILLNRHTYPDTVFINNTMHLKSSNSAK